MDAKQLIENLIGAIDAIVAAADNSDDVSAAIEDAEDTANLAKVILPSLDAPAESLDTQGALQPRTDVPEGEDKASPPEPHEPFSNVPPGSLYRN
jgi:hypothetical protein